MKPSAGLLVLFLTVNACRSTPPEDPRRAELIRRHAGIWALMGLSDSARVELVAVVAATHGAMERNRSAHPELFHAAPERAAQRTHGEYVSAHQARFDKLGLSPGRAPSF
jgi:hypothetical protein